MREQFPRFGAKVGFSAQQKNRGGAAAWILSTRTTVAPESLLGLEHHLFIRLHYYPALARELQLDAFAGPAAK